jgi:glycosyltransferase involved in cell wall biosynthesis
MLRSRWRDARSIISGLLRSQPIVIVRDAIEPMQTLIDRLLALERFDAIHADQVSMAQYGLQGNNLRRVLDLHNALYLVMKRLADNEPNPIKRLAARREARALAYYEADLCRKYDQVVFVTDEDRRAIEHRLTDYGIQVPADRFCTIPICVDTNEKRPVAPVANPQRVTALGVMFWPPNSEGALWFARQVWPRVHAQFPQARFTVVGKNPPPELNQLNGVDNIEVAGYVPDLDAILAETAVFIVPLRAGGGMRVKIVDGWSWGLPIVSTRIGAEGITLRNRENILIADSAETFGQAVMQVLSDPALAKTLRQNGRHWVEEKYDWSRVYTAWDQVYDKLLTS